MKSLDRCAVMDVRDIRLLPFEFMHIPPSRINGSHLIKNIEWFSVFYENLGELNTNP
jgi:hypothetical protein